MPATPTGMITPIGVRRVAGMSRARLARELQVSDSTLRVYEADPDAVGPDTRQRLDRAYRDLLRSSRQTRRGAA